MWGIKKVACELFKDKVEKGKTCQTWYTKEHNHWTFT